MHIKRIGGRQCASPHGVVTDELIGSREIVVKSVGPQVASVRGISGATILGDGHVALIVDCGALVKRAAAHAGGRGGGRPDRAEGRLPAGSDWATVLAAVGAV